MASLKSEPPEQALVGLLAKQIVSVFNMSKFSLKYSEEEWDEKIGDSINYLLLLYAMLQEKNFANKLEDKL